MSVCSRSLGPLYGLAAAAGMLLGACSLALDFSECKVDSDCTSASGDTYACQDGQCVQTSVGSAADTTGPEQPTTSDESTGSSSDTTVDVTVADTDTTTEATGTSACALNSECEAMLGDGHLCIDSVCVSALSNECQTLTWPSTGGHDKVVVIGSIIPSSNPYAPLTLPLQNALQLAIADYNKTTDLPGGNRIAWITCDDQGKVERAVAAAKHLTGTLKVQAIVGPIFSEQVIEVAKQVTVAAGTFIISPTATAKQITTLEDDGLVWRTITSDVYQSNAVADRVLDLEEPPVSKLALLYKDDAYGNGIASDVDARLEGPLAMGLTLHPYPDPTTLAPDDLKIAYGTILAQAWGAPADPHPDTLVFAGTTEVKDLVLGAVLLLWTQADPPVPLPRILVTHGAVPSMEDIVNDVNVPDMLKPPLMAVVEGTAPVIFDPENFSKFNARYKTVFMDTDAITPTSLSYDAGMLIMFAMAAIPLGDPITGAAIRDNIAKLQDPAGTKVSFGDVMGLELPFIKTAHNALVLGNTVDLKGISGELTFDLETGEPRTDIIGWGLVPKPNSPNTPVLTPRRIYTLQDPPSEVGDWSDL